MVPRSLQLVMQEIHAGPFGGHFAGKGLHGMLMQRYWWEGTISDIHQFCRSCLTCAAHLGAGQKCKPLLHPIPVGGLFDRVGVDIIEIYTMNNSRKSLHGGILPSG